MVIITIDCCKQTIGTLKVEIVVGRKSFATPATFPTFSSHNKFFLQYIYFPRTKAYILDLFYQFYVVLKWHLVTLDMRNFLCQFSENFLSATIFAFKVSLISSYYTWNVTVDTMSFYKNLYMFTLFRVSISVKRLWNLAYKGLSLLK